MVAHWSPAGRMSRTLWTLGSVVAAAFVATAFVGTPMACWFGSVALVKASGMSGGFALAVCGGCTIVGMAAELLKLALATQLGQLGRRCTTVVIVLWTSCIAFAWLVPLLLLAQMPIWPRSGGVFAVCAIGWAFIQLVSGLAPAMNWSGEARQAVVDPPSALVGISTLTTPPGLTRRVDDDWLFDELSKLAGQPGRAMVRGVRITQDREIIGSRRDLALLLGLTKPTLHRLLHKLDAQHRLSLDLTGDFITRITMP